MPFSSTLYDRLLEVVRGAAPVDGVSIGTPGVSASVRVDFSASATAPQRVAAQAVVDAFDWAQSAQDAWELLKTRASAKADLDQTAASGKLLRALASIVMDEFNLLRAAIIARVDFVFDPPNIANAAGFTQTQAVTGAAFGDEVSILAPYTLAGIVCTGYVHAAGTVGIRLHNSTGAAVNLVSGTWTVIVRRQPLMPPRTLAQLRTAIKNRIDDGSVDA